MAAPPTATPLAGKTCGEDTDPGQHAHHLEGAEDLYARAPKCKPHQDTRQIADTRSACNAELSQAAGVAELELAAAEDTTPKSGQAGPESKAHCGDGETERSTDCRLREASECQKRDLSAVSAAAPMRKCRQCSGFTGSCDELVDHCNMEHKRMGGITEAVISKDGITYCSVCERDTELDH